MPEFIPGMPPHINVEHEAIEHPDPENMRRYEKGNDEPKKAMTHGLDWMKG